jgi:hypothetical protein
MDHKKMSSLQLFKGVRQWVVAALSLALHASVLLCTYYSLREDALAALCMLSVWAVVLGRTMDADQDQDVATEHMLTTIVATSTLSVLGDRSSKPPNDDLIWILPLGLAVLHTALTARAPPSPPVVHSYGRRTLVAVVSVIFGSSVGMSMLAGSTSTRSILAGGHGFFSAMLVFGVRSYLVVDEEDAWAGGSSALRTWLYLQCCLLPLDAPTDDAFLIRVGTVLLVGLAVVVGRLPSPRSVPRFIVSVVQTLVDTVKGVVSSPLPYQLALLVSTGVVLQAVGSVWYTTHVTFPSGVQTLCKEALWFFDNVVKVFYDFTSAEDFQETILFALPELAALRGGIYRAMGVAYRPLLDGRDGKRLAVVPSQFTLLVAAFMPVLLIAAATLLQVFVEGRAFVRSRWFWAAGAVSGLVFLAMSQLSVDASVLLWYMVFADCGHSRVYTETGQFVLFAQLTIVSSCVALYAICAQTESDDVRLIRRIKQRQQQITTGARLELSRRRRKRAGNEEGLVKRNIRHLLDYLLSPSVVMGALAVFVLVLTILSAGSPVRSFQVVRVKNEERPAWLVSTAADKVSALGITNLMKMLNPKYRMVVLGNALVLYALEQIPQWGCICLPIPSLSDIVGIGEDIGDFFSDTFGGIFRRRRLLEHRIHSTHYGGRALVSLSPAGRRLLGSGGCSGGMTEVCVTDVVKDIVKELSHLAKDGLEWVCDMVTEGVLKLIPIVDVLDGILKQLGDIDQWLDFELFTIDARLPDVDVHLDLRLPVFSLGLDLLSNFRMPGSLHLTPLNVLLPALLVTMAVVFFAHQFGLLAPVLRTAKHSIELSVAACALAFVAALAVFLHGLHQALRDEGYTFEAELNGAAYVYGACAAMLVASLLLAVGEGEAMRVRLLDETEEESKGLLSPSLN